MIVCKIEMWPKGDATKAREIGRVLIVNIGGTATSGEYAIEIPKSAEYAKSKGTWRRGRVHMFPRVRLGPIDLLLRALIACVGDRSAAAVGNLGPNDLNSPSDAEATA